MSKEVSYLAEAVRVSDALSCSCDDYTSFFDAVGVVRDVMGARLAPTYLLNANQDVLVLVTDDQQRAELGASFSRMPAHEHVRDPWVTPDDWPVSAADHLDHEAWALLPAEFKQWFGESGVVVSLHAEARHLGAVLLCFDGPFSLTEEQRSFLAVVGRILGSALRQRQVVALERELAMLEERRRISDEIHLDLSQQVAALGLHVGLTKLDLAEGKADSVRHDLVGLEHGVETLKRTLRHQMLGLRSDAHLLEEHFVDQTRELVARFSQQTRIAVAFDATGCVERIPQTIAAQLVRVMREALANVEQHARASRVSVRLSSTSTLVRLEIEDDGTGFDPTSDFESRLGIKIMNERLHQLGGVVRFATGRPRGTLLVAEAPVRETDFVVLTDAAPGVR